MIRHRGGTCGTHSVNVLRGHSWLPHLRRTLTHRRSTGSAGPAHVPRPGHHRLMHPARDRAAIRARRRGRVIRDRPYLHTAARPGLHIGDLQALHPEQRRRRILEHDARGFLVILKSVGRPKIVGAAGSRAHGDTPQTPQITRTRPGRPPGTLSNTSASPQVTDQ